MKLLQGMAFTGSEGINSKQGYMGLCFLNLYRYCKRIIKRNRLVVSC